MHIAFVAVSILCVIIFNGVLRFAIIAIYFPMTVMLSRVLSLLIVMFQIPSLMPVFYVKFIVMGRFVSCRMHSPLSFAVKMFSLKEHIAFLFRVGSSTLPISGQIFRNI